MASAQKNQNDSEKVIIHHVHWEIVEDETEPPPPHLISKFATLQDWLLNVCEKDRPQKPISKYKVGLFDAPNGNKLIVLKVKYYHEKFN